MVLAAWSSTGAALLSRHECRQVGTRPDMILDVAKTLNSNYLTNNVDPWRCITWSFLIETLHDIELPQVYTITYALVNNLL